MQCNVECRHVVSGVLLIAAAIAAIVGSIEIAVSNHSPSTTKEVSRDHGHALSIGKVNPLGTPGSLIKVGNYSSAVGAAVSATARVTTTFTANNGEITVEAAPSNVLPAISQRAAVQAWAATGLAPQTAQGTMSPTQPTAVAFRIMSDTTMATIEPNGTTYPQYVDSPVWVVEYHHAVVALTGPHVTGPDTLPQGSVGTFEAFISADTGAYLFATATTVPTPTISVGSAAS